MEHRYEKSKLVDDQEKELYNRLAVDARNREIDSAIACNAASKQMENDGKRKIREL